MDVYGRIWMYISVYGLHYAESTTLKVLIMAQIHEKTVTHYKKDAHKLAGDRE